MSRIDEETQISSEEILKRFVWYGILFEMMNNFHKPFAVKFLERIGGNEFAMSLFSSLPGLITLFAVIPGAIFIRKMPSLRKGTLIFIAASRMLLVGLALIPFMPASIRVTAFLAFYALMCLPDSAYQTSYQAFVGRLFGAHERAYAISTRNKMTVPIVTVSTLLIGQILTNVPHTDAQRVMVYQGLYIMAFLTGVMEVFVFRGLKIIETVEENQVHFATSFKLLMRDRRFWFFTVCSLLFHFGWQMGWPLFNIYTIRDLGANEMWLAILSVASSISMFFAYSFWNREIQKRGNAYVLAVNTFGMAITPIMYVFSFNLYVLTFTSFISGIFIAGTTTVLLSGLLEATPETDRVTYLAVYSTLTNISLAVAPLVGHYFLQLGGIAFALYVTAGFRFVGSFAFFYREYKLKSTPQ